MLLKEKVIQAINRLPNEFSIDEAIDELVLLDKIEKGLEQSMSNQIMSDEDLEQELPEWLK